MCLQARAQTWRPGTSAGRSGYTWALSAVQKTFTLYGNICPITGQNRCTAVTVFFRRRLAQLNRFLQKARTAAAVPELRLRSARSKLHEKQIAAVTTQHIRMCRGSEYAEYSEGISDEAFRVRVLSRLSSSCKMTMIFAVSSTRRSGSSQNCSFSAQFQPMRLSFRFQR